MSEKKPEVSVKIIKAYESPVNKAEAPTALTDDQSSGSQWITPPLDLRGIEIMVDHSPILPQCIRAYKDNIAGFGISLRYKDDQEENEGMREEWDRADEIIKLLSIEKATKEVFEAIIEARETFGRYLGILAAFTSPAIHCIVSP